MNSVSLVDGHIDEPKLTDEQIIKALECCVNTTFISDCAKCKMLAIDCKDKLIESALDLINRQKAENDELQLKINELEIELEESRDAHIRTIADKDVEIEKLERANIQLMAILQTAQSEARKEFAKKLKRMCEKDGFVDRYDIMRLLKEMEGSK